MKPLRSPILYSSTSSGFTLVELLIVIAVSAILLALAVPNLQSFIERNRLATVSNEVISAIGYARIEAITRRTNVTLCARNSDASQTCEPLGTDADYANGWLVFLDCNSNGIFDTCDADNDSTTPNTAEVLLKTTQAYKGDLSITNSNSTTPAIKFSISGRVSAGVGTLTISANSTTYKTMDVTRSGSTYFN